MYLLKMGKMGEVIRMHWKFICFVCIILGLGLAGILLNNVIYGTYIVGAVAFYALIVNNDKSAEREVAANARAEKREELANERATAREQLSSQQTERREHVRWEKDNLLSAATAYLDKLTTLEYHVAHIDERILADPLPGKPNESLSSREERGEQIQVQNLSDAIGELQAAKERVQLCCSKQTADALQEAQKAAISFSKANDVMLSAGRKLPDDEESNSRYSQASDARESARSALLSMRKVVLDRVKNDITGIGTLSSVSG